jgi:hypothetical protein
MLSKGNVEGNLRGSGMDSTGKGYGEVVGFCVNSNMRSGSAKYGSSGFDTITVDVRFVVDKVAL